ncbi:hypothetical protein KSF73_17045 [Burkholderiaceae bacterium DAT-1]|nr:hypothetical protein [Burkholderiaceae bacterium DAT-1]
MEVTPEIESHHHKHSGHWVDYLLGGAAIAISLVSLYLGIRNAEHMERLVESNSYPDISFTSGNGCDEKTGKCSQVLNLTNKGIGPARIKTVEVSYQGKYAADADDLVSIWLGDKDTSAQYKNSKWTSRLLGELISPKEERLMMRVNDVDPQSKDWGLMQKGRLHMQVRVCYCSIFNECFVRESQKMEPEHVHSCKASQSVVFHESEPEEYWKIAPHH